MKRDLPFVGSLAIPSPEQLRADLPVTPLAEETVQAGRRTVQDILARRDPRLLVVVGPCSLHDPEAGMEYARRLKRLAAEVADTLFVVMRVYFEKPRTTVGWKGLINDPGMDGSYNIPEGLALARRILLDINDLGLPVATEALDPISPSYLSELISWAAIGARTTESQTHREMASGLPVPVGFKNGTDGNVEIAINAILAASRAHAFLGIDASGRAAAIYTEGNQYGHLVLRGGGRPNHDTVSVGLAARQMEQAKIDPRIVVDCAHGNSRKNHLLQPSVLDDVVRQLVAGNTSIVGVMIESFLEGGNQSLDSGAPLRYGCSVTDACVDWDVTETMLRNAAAALRECGRSAAPAR
jgi:3-deoxy-7-phosphoheptulonate synthase